MGVSPALSSSPAPSRAVTDGARLGTKVVSLILWRGTRPSWTVAASLVPLEVGNTTFVQRPRREGRQFKQGRFAFLHEQFLQLPLPLHRLFSHIDMKKKLKIRKGFSSKNIATYGGDIYEGHLASAFPHMEIFIKVI